MPSLIAHFLRGFAMGAADIVPGVSGGTVALVLGIYRRLVASIRRGAGALAALIRLDGRGFVARLTEIEWRFIVPLLVGVAAAVVALSHLIEALLEDHPVRMAALFFGLVAGSIVVAWRLVERRDGSRMAVLVLTAVVTFWLLGFSAGTVTDPPWWAFLLAGSMAICAMILPGVSGSFLLLMVGMYTPVLSAVTDREFLSLGVFMVGAVAGLAAFSTLLNLLLDRFHDTIMAGLIGLMAGSLRVLWPWPDGTAVTTLAAPEGDVVVPILIALAGMAAVLAVTRRESVLADRVEAAGEVGS